MARNHHDRRAPRKRRLPPDGRRSNLTFAAAVFNMAAFVFCIVTSRHDQHRIQDTDSLENPARGIGVIETGGM